MYLHGVGHFHPENEITNQFLESLDIDTNDDWIVDRVGIRTRRTVLSLDYIRETRNRDTRGAHEALTYTNAQMGAQAARMAIERAGIEPEQIGLVISGTSSPTMVCPAEACFVAAELGLQVPAYDLNSACSTFVTQLYNLSMMDDSKLPEYILTIAAESLTTTIDYTDRGSCVLFGDGAAAAVVSTRVPGRAKILGTLAESDPASAHKVVIKKTGYFEQDGRAVQMFAIRKTRQGYEALREASIEDGGDRALHFIGHQANMRVLEQVCKRCEIVPERHHSNVDVRGNTGGASAPSVLSMQWEKFGPQDDVALVVVGGGLTWSRALVRFEEQG
jgi:3-oxoacyl-[acyl-carrier-protein] synthase-3